MFTGTRAEYGLLRSLMEEIKKDKDLHLQIVVSGMHLSPEFGLTYKEIEKDGFRIDEKSKILSDSDTPEGLCKAIGSGLTNFSRIFKKLKSDIIVILGDRFEAFAAAQAAMVLRIPVAHIHGGEATYGLIDEAIRHSISKMSHLHFTSTDEYRKRVIQLGEDPERVFNVGAIGIDNIKKMKLLSKREIEKELGFKFGKRNLLVTFHPVTLEKNTSKKQFQKLLKVLDGLDGTHIIFTKANADTDGRVINKMIDMYVSGNFRKAVAFRSMGQLNYLSTMRFVDAIVGNSSSGIIETPSFKMGTINIGDRQSGRIRAKSVIDCEPTKQSIKKALKKLYSEDFLKDLKKIKNPYGNGNTAKRIKIILKKQDTSDILKKQFFDISF